MSVLDIKADARRAYETIAAGGIAIIPNDTGYGIVASTTEAVRRINEAKGRGGHKRNAMLCDMATQRELQAPDTRAQEMIEAITQDYDLPLGSVTPYRADHPLLQKVDDEMLRTSTANNTLAMLLNAGPFYNELTRLCREASLPLFGSSANLTGTGAKFRVEDIEPTIKAAADLVLDHGLRKYHVYRRSGTIIDFRDVTVIRFGICYDLIADVLRRHFNVDLPSDPGRELLPSGHVNEFALDDLRSRVAV